VNQLTPQLPTDAKQACSISGPANMSAGGRVASVDLFRGIVIALLVFNGFGLGQFSGSTNAPVWLAALFNQFEHAAWRGCNLWDLVQPAFMFLAGISAAIVAGKSPGNSPVRWSRVWRRTSMLVLLGIGGSNYGSGQSDFKLTNVLTQIGLGYPALTYLARYGIRTNLIAVLGLLGISWSVILSVPLSEQFTQWLGQSFPSAMSVSEAWLQPWRLQFNSFAQFDFWWRRLLPVSQSSLIDAGGYATLNAIPSLATMLSGIVCWKLAQSFHCSKRRTIWLGMAGLVTIALGWTLDLLEICPIIKRLWSPAFGLVSSGACCLMWSCLMLLVDRSSVPGWTRPFVVLGSNSIVMYLLSVVAHRMADSIARRLPLSTVDPLPLAVGQSIAVGLLLYAMASELYRRKLFVRL
jgi:heparan-alpha-glucosaminide N-acetyltransferase